MDPFRSSCLWASPSLCPPPPRCRLQATVGAAGAIESAAGTHVTLNGDLDLMTVNGATVHLVNGLTLNGTLRQGNAAGTTYGIVYFDNSETIDSSNGTDNILLGGSGINQLLPALGGLTITFGPNLTIHGKTGTIGGNTTYVNQGMVAADTAGGTITINPTSWSSSGTLRASGGTLSLNSNWSSSGLIDVSAGTLNLGGSFPTPSGSYSRTGGTVNLTGILNNASNTLALNANAGSWNFTGRINNGTVTESGGGLVVTNAPTLNGVTLNGDLDLMTVNGAIVHLLNGLTLNGTLRQGNAAGSTYGLVYFDNSETIDSSSGTGNILLGGSGINQLLPAVGGLTVTFGPNLTIHGKTGTIGSNSTYVNQGTIAADTAGGTITVNPTSWSSSGTIQASSGGTLNASTPTNYSSGTLTGGAWQVFSGSVLRVTMSSGIVTNAATVVLDGSNSHFYRDSGTTLALANTFSSNAAGGSFTVQNGRNFTTAGDWTNNGTLTIGAGSTFTVAGNLTNFDGASLTGGTYVVAGTFQFTNANIQNNAATLVLDGSGAAQVIDQASDNGLANLTVNAAGGSFTVQNNETFTTGGDFTNNGVLAVDPTSTFIVNLNNSLTNFSGGTLSGGTYQIAGTFQFANTGIVTNAATIVLDGSGPGQIIDQNSNRALASSLANNSGNLTVQNGRSLSTPSDFSNTGSLTIGANGTFTANGAYNQTAGSTVLADPTGTLSANAVNLQAGTLSGAGVINGNVTIVSGAVLSGSFTINGNVTSDGEIDVGGVGAVGLITINGNFTQTSNGVLNIEIGGYGAGTGYDQLAITGTATLDGTLNASLLNGFTPTSGDNFQILTFASMSGVFATTNLDPAFVNPPTYDATDVTLVAM
jgi:hypothetical protein